MGAVRKFEIALREEDAAELDQAVASGEFQDAASVVREALEAWTDRRHEHDEANIERLRRLVAEGLASGEPKEVTDAWFESIKQRGSERLKAKREAG